MDSATPPVTQQPTRRSSDHPVTIYVGPAPSFVPRCQEILQESLCQYNRCNTCRSCRLIAQKSHENILWLAPDKGYTRAHIDDLLHSLSFVRDRHDPFYCILEKAETLTAVCTNALLKSLEEPPPGYFFILGTQSLAPIAVTLQSRAHIYYLLPNAKNTLDTGKMCPLYGLFIQSTPPSCAYFLKTLEETAPTWGDYELRQLCHALLDYWVTCYQEICVTSPIHAPERKKCERVIQFLQKTLAHPFVPASTSFVLKDLFLQIFILF